MEEMKIDLRNIREAERESHRMSTDALLLSRHGSRGDGQRRPTGTPTEDRGDAAQKGPTIERLKEGIQVRTEQRGFYVTRKRGDSGRLEGGATGLSGTRKTKESV